MSRPAYTILSILTRFNDGFSAIRVREASGIIADWVVKDTLFTPRRKPDSRVPVAFITSDGYHYSSPAQG